MAMTCRVTATLDAGSEVALYCIMRRTGWTKSQVLREAIWAAAKNEGLARQPAPRRRARTKAKS
jgi:hypothetical protein